MLLLSLLFWSTLTLAQDADPFASPSPDSPEVQAEFERTRIQSEQTLRVFGETYNADIFGLSAGIASLFQPIPVRPIKHSPALENERVLTELQLYDFHNHGEDHFLRNMYGAELVKELAAHDITYRQNTVGVLDDSKRDTLLPEISERLISSVAQARKEKEKRQKDSKPTSEAIGKLSALYDKLNDTTEAEKAQLDEPDVSLDTVFKIFQKYRSNCKTVKKQISATVPATELETVLAACDFRDGNFKLDCLQAPFRQASPFKMPESEYLNNLGDVETSMGAALRRLLQQSSPSNRTEVNKMYEKLSGLMSDPARASEFNDLASFINYTSNQAGYPLYNGINAYLSYAY